MTVRPGRTDLVLGLAGALLCAGLSLGRPLGAAALGVVLGMGLALVRTWPLAGMLLATAVLVAATLAEVLPGGNPVAPYLLVPAYAFAGGRFDDSRAGLVIAAALVLAAGTCGWVVDDSGPFMASLSIAAWGAGRALRQREAVAARLAERARELEEEREAHTTLSIRYERARIAAELHDIVAHAISVMVVQATAGQRLAARDPELTSETFANLASAARQAEADLGRLVSLLGDREAIGPAPDLALVEELVAHAAASGLDVTLRLEVDSDDLPAAVAEVAYRVVQEGLTNALRYSAGSAVRVIVRGEPDRVDVSVVNGPAHPEATLSGAGTGNGLRGLRERVGACAGTVEAGPTPDGGWRLRASVPRRLVSPRAQRPNR